MFRRVILQKAWARAYCTRHEHFQSGARSTGLPMQFATAALSHTEVLGIPIANNDVIKNVNFQGLACLDQLLSYEVVFIAWLYVATWMIVRKSNG